MSVEDFSNYGTHNITDSLELSFPQNIIRIERISEKAFSYYRRDADHNEIQKIIPLKTANMELEVAPIRPLNHPARRTGHIYLEFDRKIHLMQNSGVQIFVRCPIEIGLFLGGEQTSSLDSFTCAPTQSRFGLYGPSDTGLLCKYFKSEIIESISDSVSYCNGAMPVTITNNMDAGQDIDRVVFPITDNSVYYDRNVATLDGITVTMKRRGKSNIADVQAQKLDTEWRRSPTWESTTISDALEMGLD